MNDEKAMTREEAIKWLENDSKGWLDHPSECSFTRTDILRIAMEDMKTMQKYETQWLDDLNNPLEPLKLQSALNSEIFKLKYRKEHKPNEINILDYTVIYALADCLKRYSGVKVNEMQ